MPTLTKNLYMQWSENACVQRAAWRKRGSGSPESLCEFESFALVQTAVNPPPAPSRWDVGRKSTDCAVGNFEIRLSVIFNLIN